MSPTGASRDAHAGKWHRQVSLLSHDRIEAFRARGAEVDHGAFGENLVVEGIDFATLPLGTRFRCGDVLLELTQIGKECHSHCEIFKKMGECIMPTQGVFTRVLKGGTISSGDELEVLPPALRAAVVTASDSGFAGTREDLSTPAAAALLEGAGEDLRDGIAMLAGMIIYTGLNYLGQRFFAFREKTGEKGENKLDKRDDG